VLRRRLTLVTCLLGLVTGATACGNDKKQGVDEPAREGLALNLDGIDYNVFLTRQLNPAIQEDEAYYTGPEPAPDETLYGVFLQACNNSKDPRDTADRFTVKDNQGNEFEPEQPPSDNQFAYSPRRLDPEECIPQSGSFAQLGPTGGSLLLFKLPLKNTENRPLELEIHGTAGDKLTYQLDI
jgi:hypothetical protein